MHYDKKVRAIESETFMRHAVISKGHETDIRIT